MATVRHHGAKPDLFVTMTCNPNWREIKDNLFPGQTSSDAPIQEAMWEHVFQCNPDLAFSIAAYGLQNAARFAHLR
jgi:hypothetical protein